MSDAHRSIHSARPHVERPDAGSAPDGRLDPWPQYAAAVIELLIDGRHLVLTPTDHGDATGRQDEARGAASPTGPLTAFGPPIWILTAGDPYPVELEASENAARLARLCDELDAAGLRHDPALGRSQDGAVSEVSRAVRGTDRSSILALAGRHGQLAVYELTDRIDCVDVGSAHAVTSCAYRLRSAPAGSDELVGPTGWRG